jgi:hypothetical protein
MNRQYKDLLQTLSALPVRFMGDGRPFIPDGVTNLSALPMGTTITQNQLPVSEPNPFKASSVQQLLPLPEYDIVESALDMEDICMFMDMDTR